MSGREALPLNPLSTIQYTGVAAPCNFSSADESDNSGFPFADLGANYWTMLRRQGAIHWMTLQLSLNLLQAEVSTPDRIPFSGMEPSHWLATQAFRMLRYSRSSGCVAPFWREKACT
ncbi:hypothetical protein L7F22_039791 [Adiantum nelumboides]|nr:hypothetical protein [Adiantum nelumboides]